MLRFDPLTREWVNIVGHRQHRPNLPTEGCPFCPGGLEAPAAYDVRAFTNRWPSLSPGDPVDLASLAATGATEAPAVGTTEVVLYSSRHRASLATLGVEQVRKVVDIWAERTEALLARDDIRYVLVFENRGPEVGATIHHPHGQLYAYGWIPPVPRRLADITRTHGDPVAAELARERSDGARIVSTRGTFTAYVPYASAYPFGVRIVPDADVQRIADLDDEGRTDLASALVDVTTRYDALFPECAEREVPFPYMMWLHQSPEPAPAQPPDRSIDPWFRLHVQFAPPWRAAGLPRYVASGELGSGTFANPVVPEDAAAMLRGALGAG